jgi:hypothetical protein
MTKRDLIAAALKVYGVILIAQTVIGSVMYIELVITAAHGNYSPAQSAGAMIAAWICYVVVSLAMGVFLVWDGDRIARLTVRADALLPSLDFKRDARWVLAIALTALGVYFIAIAITGLAHDVAYAFLRSVYAAMEHGESASGYKDLMLQHAWVDQRTQIVEALIRLLLGAVLALWGNGIAGLLWRDRAQEPPASEPPQPTSPRH